MILFAQDQATNLTIGGMAIAAVASAVTALFSWLAARDRLRFDSTLKLLQATIANCEQEHKDAKEAFLAIRIKFETTERESAKHEGELASTNRELISLRDEVKELRDRLYGKVK